MLPPRFLRIPPDALHRSAKRAAGRWLDYAPVYEAKYHLSRLIVPGWGLLDPVDHRVCAQHRFAFVHVPKTGGKSIRMSLFGKTGGSCHAPIDLLLSQLPDEGRGYYVFAFVRNPWDRLHSAYRYLARGGNQGRGDRAYARRALGDVRGFEDFLLRWLSPETIELQPLLWSQSRFLEGRDGRRPDFIGRYESLGEDFQAVAQRFGLSGSLTRKNTSPEGKDYRAAYTTKMVDAVVALYPADVSALGYEFE